mmetsp:Transcript_1162/g.2173  ORF Transcript_1162/g.2173 Transcript_1162/m.2173 type:complete len:181 (-) Transcript_1162:1350-1892(-)
MYSVNTRIHSSVTDSLGYVYNFVRSWFQRESMGRLNEGDAAGESKGAAGLARKLRSRGSWSVRMAFDISPLRIFSSAKAYSAIGNNATPRESQAGNSSAISVTTWIASPNVQGFPGFPIMHNSLLRTDSAESGTIDAAVDEATPFKSRVPAEFMFSIAASIKAPFPLQSMTISNPSGASC